MSVALADSPLADLPPPVTLAPPVRVEAFTVIDAPREVYDRLPEGTRAEFIDGRIYMSPAPLPRHQDVVQNLYRVLFAYAEAHGGYVGVAPYDVAVAPTRNLQPDVFYLAPDQLDLIGEKNIEGAPTLVAEVLSTSTTSHDLRLKRTLYAEASVAEYWILDPAERTVEILALTNDGYRTAAEAGRGEEIASAALPGFRADVDEVFRRAAFPG